METVFAFDFLLYTAAYATHESSKYHRDACHKQKLGKTITLAENREGGDREKMGKALCSTSTACSAKQTKHCCYAGENVLRQYVNVRMKVSFYYALRPRCVCVRTCACVYASFHFLCGCFFRCFSSSFSSPINFKWCDRMILFSPMCVCVRFGTG